jgi:hypothetical protein
MNKRNPVLAAFIQQGIEKPERGAARRASFSSATSPENVGVTADVPPIEIRWPCQTIWNLRACAETSGMPWLACN